MTRVLVTGARAPVALDLARSLVAAGMTVHLADSVTPWAARLSSLAVPIHAVPSPRHRFPAFRRSLGALVTDGAFDLVVPTCEEVFYVATAAALDGYADRVFAPSPVLLRTLHSKLDFPVLAAGAGIEVPETIAINDPATVATLDMNRYVLKPEFSRFGTATLIRPSARQVASVRLDLGRWVAQRYIVGQELSLWSSVRDGRVTALAAYRPRWRHGRSAAYMIEAINHPAAATVAHRIAAATGMTGHLSLDLIETADGRAIPIECNPRAVSGLHLFDADPAVARALLGTTIAGPPAGRLRHLSPAMALLGLPTALRMGRKAALLRDWRASRDAIGRGRDRGAIVGTMIDAARFAALGLAGGRHPAGQTTDDIEWNGEPIG